MRKKILAKLVICTLAISSVLPVASVSAAYKGSKAAAYAKDWAESYNTKQYYIADLDCTNFVSQCLVAGGKTPSKKLPKYDDVNYWKPHSATWENATYFRKYWSKRVFSGSKKIEGMSNDAKKSYAISLATFLSEGDVIQYAYNTDKVYHSQICHAKARDNSGNMIMKMAQHTDGKKNISLPDYFAAKGFNYVYFYQMSRTI
ncbi:MAG: amidase domain-containing protein [Eubacterium sp.]|nr:amidase domain-containing protein [Eubacterium sp.]